MTATGYFVRAKRDGKWQSLDIVELTDDELDAFERCQAPDKGWQWAKALAGWIRDHMFEFAEVPEAAKRIIDESTHCDEGDTR